MGRVEGNCSVRVDRGVKQFGAEVALGWQSCCITVNIRGQSRLITVEGLVGRGSAMLSGLGS